MKSIMTHLVAGYPNVAESKKILKHMVDQNILAVEVQVPFSDPIADGPVLMRANDVAVANHVNIDAVFDIIDDDFEQTQIYIMSYVQPMLSYGFEKFFTRALQLGVAGFIVPDLPFDAPETSRFIELEPRLRTALVPVLSQGMSIDRLRALFDLLSPEVVYVTARHGITGDKTADFSTELTSFIADIRKLTNAKVALGFGIQSADDVKKASKIADIPVVGSAITKQIEHKALAPELVNNLAAAAKIV